MKKIIFSMMMCMMASTGCINGIDQIVSGEKTSAVVIGVENGIFAGKCPGSLKDADDMAKLLKKHTSDVQVLKDQKATAAAVYSAISKAVKSDLAIIYFSGHGGSEYSPGSDEADGCDEYICCFDQALLDNEIWTLICHARGRVFLIFDCCHSETMFKSLGMKFNLAQRVFSSAKGVKMPSMLCWSGCPDDSYSYGSDYGGEFTSALLRYAQSSKSYDDVWKKLSRDASLAAKQQVRATKIGSFDTKKSIFK